MTFTLLVLLALATYRATRLVVEDSLLDRQRRWLYDALEGRKVAELLVCPFCAGVWLAAFLTYTWFHPWVRYWPLGTWLVWLLAISGGQALLSSVDARLNDH